MFRHAAGLLLLLGSRALAQSAPLSFEAADLKPNKSGDVRMMVDFQPGGRLSARNVPLKILIALAWRVRPDSVTAGPNWLASDRYDVVAKAAQTTPPDDLRRMLQTLLAERFKLSLHVDRKPMPAYALLLAKSGAKLDPSTPGLLTEQRCRPGDPIPGQKQVICEHMSMTLFADTLQELAPRDLDAPVINQTDLAGAFAFKLTWSPAARPPSADTPEPLAGPTLSEALENQLGLKLENRKLPLPVLVIDRIERVPVEN